MMIWALLRGCTVVIKLWMWSPTVNGLLGKMMLSWYKGPRKYPRHLWPERTSLICWHMNGWTHTFMFFTFLSDQEMFSDLLLSISDEHWQTMASWCVRSVSTLLSFIVFCSFLWFSLLFFALTRSNTVKWIFSEPSKQTLNNLSALFDCQKETQQRRRLRSTKCENTLIGLTLA